MHSRHLDNWLFGLFAFALTAIILAIQLVEDFHLRARLTDALFVGGAVPILGLLGVEVSRMKLNSVLRPVNLYIIAMLGIGVGVGAARISWLVYREAHEQITWLRDMATAWLSVVPIFCFALYSSWEAVDGNIRAKAYFWWWGFTGAAVALILVIIAILGG